jgi:L-ascorbate metabolism protein UlaG (beta-lactamase superfamily)
MSHFGGIEFTWLGHATCFLKTAAGTSVLIDPWITGNPKYPSQVKDFGKVDLMLLTHGHSDHTGDALAIAKQYNPTTICMVELAYLLAGQGLNMEKAAPMNLGGSQVFGDLGISMVEAKHSSSFEVDGKPVYAGVAGGFMVKVANGPTIYFSGDTALFSDMKLLRDLYAPDIAVLSIGDFYTMGAKHAAIAAEWLGVKKVVPIHWGTFPALSGTPKELKEALAGKNIEVIEMAPGEARS